MSNSTPNGQTSHSDEGQKQNALVPEHISLDKWADTGFEWAGTVEPTSFSRLNGLLNDAHAQEPLDLDADLYRRSNVLHLAFKTAGKVWLTCQRCLQPVAIDLTANYNIALLNDESQVNLVDESQDYLLLDEVIDSTKPDQLLPFKKIIEDELLLKIPMAPKHDDCEMAATQVGEIPEDEENENPFAALAALKGKL